MRLSTSTSSSSSDVTVAQRDRWDMDMISNISHSASHQAIAALSLLSESLLLSPSCHFGPLPKLFYSNGYIDRLSSMNNIMKFDPITSVHIVGHSHVYWGILGHNLLSMIVAAPAPTFECPWLWITVRNPTDRYIQMCCYVKPCKP